MDCPRSQDLHISEQHRIRLHRYMLKHTHTHTHTNAYKDTHKSINLNQHIHRHNFIGNACNVKGNDDFIIHTGQRLSEGVSEATGRRRVRIRQSSLDCNAAAPCSTASCTLTILCLHSVTNYRKATLLSRPARRGGCSPRAAAAGGGGGGGGGSRQRGARAATQTAPWQASRRGS